jgi:hypothetical protein
VLALIVGGTLSAEGTSMATIQKSEFDLPYKVASTPVVWRPRPADPWMIALVAVEEQKGGAATSVDVVQRGGRRVSGFPVLRHNPPLVAPANQAVAVDVDGDGSVELLVIDFDGRPHAFKSNGQPISRTVVANPVSGLLPTPPQRVDGIGTGASLLLVSRDAQPGARSRHGVNLIGTDGRTRPGFPVALPSTAEQRAPIVDARSGRVFVLLENGQVEAFRLADGARPAGFPAGAAAAGVVAGTRHMAFIGSANALYVSSGGAGLQRIDASDGRIRQVAVAGAQRLTGLASAGDRLYAYDEAAGALLALDADGKPLASLPLQLSAGSKCYSLQAVAGKAANATVLIVAAPEPGSDATVDRLFEQHATPAARTEIRELANAGSKRRYGSLNLTDAQRKEESERIGKMKRSYLENTLGMAEAAALISGEALTNLRGVSDKGAGLQLLMQDEIKNYTPDTGFLLADSVQPRLSIDPEKSAAIWIVPVNISERAEGGKAKGRSLVRIYEFPI